MPQLRLIPVDARQKRVPWLFSIDEVSARLNSADSQAVAFFLHEMADHRIILPSFWESIEHLGIVADTGEPIWFLPEKESLAKIRAYLHWTLGIQGDEPTRKLRRKAKSSFFWGISCLLLGLLVLVFGNLEGIIHHLALAVCVFGVLELARSAMRLKKIKEIRQVQTFIANDQE